MAFDKLRAEIDKRNMTINKLARLSDITSQSLYAAMNGDVKFWPGWKNRIADALEMDVDDLFPEENDGKA